jgi:hypothetical protein
MKKRLIAILALLVVFVASASPLDFTKTQGEALVWTLLDDTATNAPFVTTGTETVADGSLEWELSIVVAHIDTNDASNSYVTVVVSSRAGADGTAWRQVASLEAGGGQATSEGLDDVPSTTTIPVDATTDWDDGDGGVWLLLKDIGTLSNSELVFVGIHLMRRMNCMMV